jgi:hypothetical protein
MEGLFQNEKETPVQALFPLISSFGDRAAIPPFSQLIRTFSRTIRAEPPNFDGMGNSTRHKKRAIHFWTYDRHCIL